MNYSNAGVRVDLTLRQGCTFDREVLTFRAMLGTAARDLSTITAMRAQIRTFPWSDIILATFEYEPINAAQGHIHHVQVNHQPDRRRADSWKLSRARRAAVTAAAAPAFTYAEGSTCRFACGAGLSVRSSRLNPSARTS